MDDHCLDTKFRDREGVDEDERGLRKSALETFIVNKIFTTRTI